MVLLRFACCLPIAVSCWFTPCCASAAEDFRVPAPLYHYRHPDFQKERITLGSDAFGRFVTTPLQKSRSKLETELGSRLDLLARPFGIYDDGLIRKAVATGYVANFTIERRHAAPSKPIMKTPRYLLVNFDSGRAFARLLDGNAINGLLINLP